MARLQFCDYHNMVAILKKGEFNTDFHPMVDFIAASPLRIVPLFDIMLVHQGEGSGTQTEPHHTPFPEDRATSAKSSILPRDSAPRVTSPAAEEGKEAPETETSTEEFTEDKIKEIMQLVPVEDVYVQALQVKHSIIDWKVHSEGERSYWQIIRLGGSSACYQFFIDLLRQLDREDLNQLWALVKEYLSIRPASSDKEMELWVELKRMFEPDPEDQLWTLTQNYMHAPVEWKLYDLSGVHHVTAKDKEIFILVEKDYPLRRGMVEPKAVKVEQYLWSLTKSIHGDVTSSQPATINDAGHRKKDCPKLGRNGPGGNNRGGVYQLGAVNAQKTRNLLPVESGLSYHHKGGQLQPRFKVDSVTAIIGVTDKKIIGGRSSEKGPRWKVGGKGA
nr:hypothetical protein [Tanacetum cinerariifolium]